MLGITSPYTHEIPEYLGYDITKFKGNIRFLEVVLNREGESNNIVALYFDGATNYFKELPLPNDTSELEKIYKYINNVLRKKTSSVFLLLNNKINIKNNRQKLFNKWNVIVEKIKQEIL